MMTDLLSQNNERGYVDKIAKAVRMAIRKPYGKKAVSIDDYFQQFDDAILQRFTEKLATSKWVNNPRFSIDLVVRQDLVREMVGGNQEQSKYYKVETLVLGAKNV